MNKKILAIVGVVVFAVVIAIGILALFFGGEKEPKENLMPVDKITGYRALWEFYYVSGGYQDLILGYSTIIGNNPNLVIDENDIMFPLYEDDIELLKGRIEKSEDKFEEIMMIDLNDASITKGQEETFKEMRKKIRLDLMTMEKNIDVIDDFYDAYFRGIFNGNVPDKCVKTDDMKQVEKKYKKVAKKYYDLHCEIVDYIYKYGYSSDVLLFKQNHKVAIEEAAEALNSLLDSIEPNQVEIEMMLRVLSAD